MSQNVKGIRVDTWMCDIYSGWTIHFLTAIRLAGNETQEKKQKKFA